MNVPMHSQRPRRLARAVIVALGCAASPFLFAGNAAAVDVNNGVQPLEQQGKPPFQQASSDNAASTSASENSGANASSASGSAESGLNASPSQAGTDQNLQRQEGTAQSGDQSLAGSESGQRSESGHIESSQSNPDLQSNQSQASQGSGNAASASGNDGIVTTNQSLQSMAAPGKAGSDLNASPSDSGIDQNLQRREGIAKSEASGNGSDASPASQGASGADLSSGSSANFSSNASSDANASGDTTAASDLNASPSDSGIDQNLKRREGAASSGASQSSSSGITSSQSESATGSTQSSSSAGIPSSESAGTTGGGQSSSAGSSADGSGPSAAETQYTERMGVVTPHEAVVGTTTTEAGLGSEQQLGAPNDEQLLAKVVAQLAGSPRLRGADIRVNVDHGKVTLTGSAKDADQSQHAQLIARSVAGNGNVTNNLQTSP